MNINFNPESTFSENDNYYYTFKNDLPYRQKDRQNSINNKKPSLNHQNTARSVAKFKRTNPNMYNNKPASPYPQRSQNIFIGSSRRNCLKDQQGIEQDEKFYNIDEETNLTTSRQTTNQQQKKTILFVSPSKEHKIFLNERDSPTRDIFHHQRQDMKSLNSLKSGKSSNKGSKPENENYSLYWKRKANEYLENNFKLSEEISELKRQLNKYEKNQVVETSATNSHIGLSDTESQSKNEKSVPVYIVEMQQKNYYQQITQLEISNRLKDSVIENLQNKIIELTEKIQGEQQKSELLQKMRRQIAELEHKNKKLVKQQKQQEKISKMNKVYETEKILQEIKQKSKPSVQIAFSELNDYKFQKDLDRHRYRSLE